MRFGIVEGEPGIFPDPVARLLRLLARPFRSRASEEDDTDPPGDDDNVEHPQRRQGEPGPKPEETPGQQQSSTRERPL